MGVCGPSSHGPAKAVLVKAGNLWISSFHQRCLQLLVSNGVCGGLQWSAAALVSAVFIVVCSGVSSGLSHGPAKAVLVKAGNLWISSFHQRCLRVMRLLLRTATATRMPGKPPPRQKQARERTEIEECSDFSLGRSPHSPTGRTADRRPGRDHWRQPALRRTATAVFPVLLGGRYMQRFAVPPLSAVLSSAQSRLSSVAVLCAEQAVFGCCPLRRAGLLLSVLLRGGHLHVFPVLLGGRYMQRFAVLSSAQKALARHSSPAQGLWLSAVAVRFAMVVELLPGVLWIAGAK